MVRISISVRSLQLATMKKLDTHALFTSLSHTMPPRPRIGSFDPFALKSSPSSSVCSQCLHHSKPRLIRSFSSTHTPQASRMRQNFYDWLEGPGSAFKHPLPGSTNYLSAYNLAGELMRAKRTGEEEVAEEDRGRTIPKESTADLRVFPKNPVFLSESVLSEEHKDAIWSMVKDEGKSVREVSNLLGVDMNRVGAVVRLKAVEKDWKQKGKPLANAYNRAILNMVPVTPFSRELNSRREPIAVRSHESINDLAVHRSTTEQIFFPASESRQFSRTDAGNVFEKGLLPADARIPHPEAIEFHRGQDTEELREQSLSKLNKFYTKELQERRDRKDKLVALKEKNTVTVEGDRAIFQITNVTVDEHTVGKKGRGVKGVGVRYGLPHQDRKKGQVKIPTSVR